MAETKPTHECASVPSNNKTNELNSNRIINSQSHVDSTMHKNNSNNFQITHSTNRKFFGNMNNSSMQMRSTNYSNSNRYNSQLNRNHMYPTYYPNLYTNQCENQAELAAFTQPLMSIRFPHENYSHQRRNNNFPRSQTPNQSTNRSSLSSKNESETVVSPPKYYVDSFSSNFSDKPSSDSNSKTKTKHVSFQEPEPNNTTNTIQFSSSVTNNETNNQYPYWTQSHLMHPMGHFNYQYNYPNYSYNNEYYPYYPDVRMHPSYVQDSSEMMMMSTSPVCTLPPPYVQHSFQSKQLYDPKKPKVSSTSDTTKTIRGITPKNKNKMKQTTHDENSVASTTETISHPITILRKPSIDTEVTISSAAVKTETPLAEKKIETSSVKENIETSSTEEKTETSSAEANIETPSTEEKTETSSGEEHIETPSTEEKTETSSAEANIETPCAEEKAEISTTEEKTEISSAEANIETPCATEKTETSSGEEHVETPSTKEKTEISTTEEKTETSSTKEKTETSSAEANIEAPCAEEKTETSSTKENTVTVSNEISSNVLSKEEQTINSQINEQSIKEDESKSMIPLTDHELLSILQSANSISSLNEYAQQKKFALNYNYSANSPSSFTCTVIINNRRFPLSPSCSSKNEAQKLACNEALRVLYHESTTNPQSSIEYLSKYDHIAHRSISKFQNLNVNELLLGRKTLACMLMITDGQYDQAQVISVATGNTCLDETNLQYATDGIALHDCHAEILSRRGLIKYLFQQIKQSYDNQSSIFEYDSTNKKFQLRENVTFHMYISSLPCGNAAMNISTNSIRYKQGQTEGTVLPSTSSMKYPIKSCSDKIYRWNILGIQGGLLINLITKPIYLETITFGCETKFDPKYVKYSLCTRFDEHFHSLISPFSIHIPDINCPKMKSFIKERQVAKIQTSASAWNITESDKTEILEPMIGRIKSGRSMSSLSKRNLFKDFTNFIEKNFPNDPSLTYTTYQQAKQLNKTYVTVKNLISTVFENESSDTNVSWLSKSDQLEQFTIK